jgi:hypothetical protein
LSGLSSFVRLLPCRRRVGGGTLIPLLQLEEQELGDGVFNVGEERFWSSLFSSGPSSSTPSSSSPNAPPPDTGTSPPSSTAPPPLNYTALSRSLLVRTFAFLSNSISSFVRLLPCRRRVGGGTLIPLLQLEEQELGDALSRSLLVRTFAFLSIPESLLTDVEHTIAQFLFFQLQERGARIRRRSIGRRRGGR